MRIAYDGRGFAGWQRQDNGVAVQEVLEKAVAAVFGSSIRIYGASRTDSGVHALGQEAHFHQLASGRDFDAEEVQRALNAFLPPTIRVMAVRSGSPDFHAQYSAKGKRYRYSIYNARILPPLEIGRTWQVPLPLDLAAMRAGAAHLVGKQDFWPFAVTSKDKRKSSVRTIYRLEIRKRGPHVDIVVEGDGFLYRMVRSIVGALVHVGLNKQPPEWIRQRLETRERPPGIVTAPPQGLCLERVFYRSVRTPNSTLF